MLVKVFEGVWVDTHCVSSITVEIVEGRWVARVLYSCGGQHVETDSEPYHRQSEAVAEMDRVAGLINKGA